MKKKKDYTVEIYSDEKISVQEIYHAGKLFGTVRCFKKAIQASIERKKKLEQEKNDTLQMP